MFFEMSVVVGTILEHDFSYLENWVSDLAPDLLRHHDCNFLASMGVVVF